MTEIGNGKVPYSVEFRGTIDADRVPELIGLLSQFSLAMSVNLHLGEQTVESEISNSPFLDMVVIEKHRPPVPMASGAGANRYAESVRREGSGIATRTFNSLKRSRKLGDENYFDPEKLRDLYLNI